MARVIGGILESDGGEGRGTSFFVDPAAAARLSTELQAASDRLFDVELGVRSAVAAVDDPSAGAISGVLNDLGLRTADLAATTGTVGDRMAEPLKQVAAMSGIPRIPEPGSIITDAADLFLPPHRESVPITPRQTRPPVPPLPAPNPLRDRTPVPPLPEPSPFREFPLIPWPLFGFTDTWGSGAARRQLEGTRWVDAVTSFATGVTTEGRVQVAPGGAVRDLVPKIPGGDARPQDDPLSAFFQLPLDGLTDLSPVARIPLSTIGTTRALTRHDPLGGDPYAEYNVFSRSVAGAEVSVDKGLFSARANKVGGVYQDVAFVRSQESAALDREGRALPLRFDPAELNPGDQVSITRRLPGDPVNSTEATGEVLYGIGGKYGVRTWEGQRVSLQELPDGGVDGLPHLLDVGQVSGDRERYELAGRVSFSLPGDLGVALRGGLQLNTRNETFDGLRYAFGDVATDPEGHALARTTLDRAVAFEEPLFPPGTRVDDYHRHRYEQTVDAELSGDARLKSLVSPAAGLLVRSLITGSSVLTERTRDQTLVSNGPGGWTTYLDHGTGQDTVTIQHYGVNPDLDGSIPLDVTIPGVGMTVSLGELHLGGLREPFRTTIAKPYAVDDPDTPVQITVEALGERREFTQEQARARASQLVADSDPRAANPVVASLAAGESWQDAIGYSGAPGEGGDVLDGFRALVGPSNIEVGQAAIALTDPAIPPVPSPDPRRAPWPAKPHDMGLPPEWWSNQSAAFDEPALWDTGLSFPDVVSADIWDTADVWSFMA